MKPILQVEHLSKDYSGFSLQDVSFSLPGGAIMGFVGENGAGKTTTIKLILNLVAKKSGSIQLFGLDHIEKEREVKDQIGVVLDESRFHNNLTADEVALILKNCYSNWDQPVFERYCKRFNLPKQKKIKEFSKGMTMKLSLAAALSHHPKLLILDEATSGLDPIVREEVLDVFLEFIQDEEHSIFFSSHITSDLEKIADYITFIHEGKIVFSKSKEELLEEYGVLHCNREAFEKLDKKQIVGYRKNEFGFDVLITGRLHFAAVHPELVIDPANIEEVMTYYVRGEVR